MGWRDEKRDIFWSAMEANKVAKNLYGIAYDGEAIAYTTEELHVPESGMLDIALPLERDTRSKTDCKVNLRLVNNQVNLADLLASRPSAAGGEIEAGAVQALEIIFRSPLSLLLLLSLTSLTHSPPLAASS